MVWILPLGVPMPPTELWSCTTEIPAPPKVSWFLCCDFNNLYDLTTEGLLYILTSPLRTFYIAYISAIFSISLFNTAPAKVAVKEKPLSNQTPSFFFGTDRGALIYADDLGEWFFLYFNFYCVRYQSMTWMHVLPLVMPRVYVFSFLISNFILHLCRPLHRRSTTVLPHRHHVVLRGTKQPCDYHSFFVVDSVPRQWRRQSAESCAGQAQRATGRGRKGECMILKNFCFFFFTNVPFCWVGWIQCRFFPKYEFEPVSLYFLHMYPFHSVSSSRRAFNRSSGPGQACWLLPQRKRLFVCSIWPLTRAIIWVWTMPWASTWTGRTEWCVLPSVLWTGELFLFAFCWLYDLEFFIFRSFVVGCQDHLQLRTNFRWYHLSIFPLYIFFIFCSYLAVGTQLGIVAVWKFSGQARDVHAQVRFFWFVLC